MKIPNDLRCYFNKYRHRRCCSHASQFSLPYTRLWVHPHLPLWNNHMLCVCVSISSSCGQSKCMMITIWHFECCRIEQLQDFSNQSNTNFCFSRCILHQIKEKIWHTKIIEQEQWNQRLLTVNVFNGRANHTECNARRKYGLCRCSHFLIWNEKIKA